MQSVQPACYKSALGSRRSPICWQAAPLGQVPLSHQTCTADLQAWVFCTGYTGALMLMSRCTGASSEASAACSSSANRAGAPVPSDSSG